MVEEFPSVHMPNADVRLSVRWTNGVSEPIVRSVAVFDISADHRQNDDSVMELCSKHVWFHTFLAYLCMSITYVYVYLLYIILTVTDVYV